MRHLKDVARRVAWIAALAVGAGLPAALPAAAHHSFAMFDNEHQVKMKGTVEEFEWTNPHIYIVLLVDDPAGGPPKHYTVEGASPGILNRVGWKFNLIKPGQKLTLIVAPLRDGQGGGLLKEVTLPDGRVLNNGGFAGPATIH